MRQAKILIAATATAAAFALGMTANADAAVGGTPFGTSGSAIRNAPYSSATQIGGIPYGQWATVWCYTEGSSVGGDPYWDEVSYAGTIGFADDYWLNTGGDITTQVPHC